MEGNGFQNGLEAVGSRSCAIYKKKCTLEAMRDTIEQLHETGVLAFRVNADKWGR